MNQRFLQYCTLLLFLCLTWTSIAQVRDGVVRSRNNNVPPQAVRTMAEWEEVEGIVIAWRNFPDILTEIVRYAKDEGLVYIVATDDAPVRQWLNNAGITDQENLRFVLAGVNSIWIRDYGPWTVYLDEVEARGISDYIYNRPHRQRDDQVPYEVADFIGDPVYNADEDPFSWIHTGGNFLRDGVQAAYSSDLVLRENSGKTGQEIAQYAKLFFGIEDYRIVSRLDYDTIHHLDMHMRILDEETIAVGEYPEGVADGPVIEENLRFIRNHYRTPYGKPYRILRLPMPPQNGQYPPFADYYTYTNSVFLNSTILVPTYGIPEDEAALQLYEDYFPGYRVVGIDCSTIISRLGALHCITKLIGVREPLWIAHPRLRDTYDANSFYAVEARIYHRDGIAEAQLHYRLAGESNYFTVEMEADANVSDLWLAQIPAQEPGTEVQYYIEALANDGKRQVRPLPAPEGYYNFEVKPFVEPPTANWVQTLMEVPPGTQIRFSNDSRGGVTHQQWLFAGGVPASSSSAEVVVSYEEVGSYSVDLMVENPLGTNILSQPGAVRVCESHEPFQASFDLDANSNWEILNPEQDGVSWQWKPDGGCTGGCLEVAHRQADRKLNREYLRTAVDLRQLARASLQFNVAYAQRHPAHFDELRVNLVDQEGQRHNIYNKGGNVLSTVDSLLPNFVPSTCEHWRRDTISLADWEGGQILLEIESIGDRGNSVFLDEIAIDANTIPTAAIVYPANDTVFVGDGMPLQEVVRVEANDVDGSIAQIDFFLDSEYLGSVTEGPYEMPFTLPAYGQYYLQARAVDNEEAQVWTERVLIRYDFQNDLPTLTTLPITAFITPNPVRDQAVLRIESSENYRAVHFSIHDTNGRQLSQWQADITPGQNRFDLQQQNLPGGTYHLRILHNDQQFSLPWVKM